MTDLQEELLGDIPPMGFPWTASALTDLLLRPERFFETLLRHELTRFPFFVVWVVGTARVMDRIDTRQAMYEVLGYGTPLSVLTSSWLSLWAGILFWGVLIGMLTWFLGGLWFRLRLRFCGAGKVDPGAARRVFIYGELVAAAPSMIWLVLVTFTYRDYQTASLDAPLALALLPTVYWSIWVSYRGATGCFPVKRNLARFWFLILPMSLISVIFLSAFVVSIATMF
jgi:hypothetical protein